jgi:hypothetical protein
MISIGEAFVATVFAQIFHQNRPAGKEARYAWEPGPLRVIRVDCAMSVTGPLTLQHSPSKLAWQTFSVVPTSRHFAVARPYCLS